jgi:serine/threonine-protein kinase
MKALAKDKNLRYQTCAAFNRDLSRFLNTQYPEFSPHDFSLHIKQAFSQLYLETKKKLVEYSKVTAHGADDKTQVTQTLTNTDASGSRNDDSLSFDMNGRKVEFSSGNEQKVNLNDLKTKKNATRLVPTVGTGSFSINNQNSPQVTTSTSIRPGTVTGYRPMPSQNNSNLWINLLMLVAVGLGGFWGYQKYDAKTRGDIAGQFTGETSTTLPTAGQTDSASSVQKPPPVQMNAVMIESVPNGARIFIDGKDSGMITPARTNIEANREFTLGLRKEGYHFYERKETATRNGLTVSATMQAATDIGYLTIEIINGGSDPVILLNNQRLTEKPPIRMLAVPADKPLKIEAYNVFTKLRAVQTVQVGNNQRRQVNLILSRDAREK